MIQEELREKIESIIDNGTCLEEIVEELSTLGRLRFQDEKIDDGLDDCEDTYLMLQLYELTIEDTTFTIRLYYGNNTREVTYYTIG